MERHDIRSLRVKYLRAITAYREEGRPIVYAEETYIHSSHTTSYAWDDGSGMCMCGFCNVGVCVYVWVL